MRRMNFLYIAMLACLVSACEWQERTDGGAAGRPGCGDAAAVAQYRELIHARVVYLTAARIGQDYADLVDGARVADGFLSGTVNLDNARRDHDADTEQQTCRAQLNVTLRPDVFELARTYAPFVYTPNRYGMELNNVANVNLISRQDNVFTQMVGYTITVTDGQPVITAHDAEIARMAQTLTTALLPYGVKDTVTVNGIPLPREDALRQIAYPTIDDQGADNVFHAASSVPPVSAASAGASYDLKAVQNRFATAQEELNTLWLKLDDTVRQSLAEEEGQWAAALDKRCATTARPVSVPPEYARLECRSRMMEERVRYLRGFAIDD